jgi:hypothetical protein
MQRKQSHSNRNSDRQYQQSNGSSLKNVSHHTDRNVSTTPVAQTQATNTPIIGTCLTMPKAYYRLVGIAKPDEIRPQHVLEKWLAELLQKRNDKTINYEFFSDQMKAIRQDLQVQHLEDLVFVQRVYTSHMSAALEHVDMQEALVCLTQLLQKKIETPKPEWIALRIAFMVQELSFFESNSSPNSLTAEAELSSFLSSLDLSLLTSEYVLFALDLATAVLLGNYRHYFKLYSCSPTPDIKHLLSHRIGERQKRAALVMCKAFSPTTLPLSFFLKQIGLNLEDFGSSSLREFLVLTSDVVFDNVALAQAIVDCKRTVKERSK